MLTDRSALGNAARSNKYKNQMLYKGMVGVGNIGPSWSRSDLSQQKRGFQEGPSRICNPS